MLIKHCLEKLYRICDIHCKYFICVYNWLSRIQCQHPGGNSKITTSKNLYRNFIQSTWYVSLTSIKFKVIHCNCMVSPSLPTKHFSVLLSYLTTFNSHDNSAFIRRIYRSPKFAWLILSCIKTKTLQKISKKRCFFQGKWFAWQVRNINIQFFKVQFDTN